MADLSGFPLTGKRIVITRAFAQSESLARALSARKAHPVLLPLIAFADPADCAPLDDAIARWHSFDWVVFTSANAVRAVIQRRAKVPSELALQETSPRLAAVGPATAAALEEAGYAVDRVASIPNGLDLARSLAPEINGRAVFLPRSDRANPDLPAALAQSGAIVTEVVAYRTLPPSDLDRRRIIELAHGAADSIVFFSPSAVHTFIEALGQDAPRDLDRRLFLLAVGPVTATALRNAGWQHIAVAADTTEHFILAALDDHFAAVGAKHV